MQIKQESVDLFLREFLPNPELGQRSPIGDETIVVKKNSLGINDTVEFDLKDYTSIGRFKISVILEYKVDLYDDFCYELILISKSVEL